MFQGQHLAHYELKKANVETGEEFHDVTGKYSRQDTIIFNTYVYMQLFNEINSRKLNGELNPFGDISKNKYFAYIWFSTVLLQAILAEVGGPVIGCSSDGLTFGQWMFCLGVGAGVLPWQFFVNLTAKLFQNQKYCKHN